MRTGKARSSPSPRKTISSPIRSLLTTRIDTNTQGLKFTWLNGDNDLPQWAKKLSDDLPQLGLHTTAQNLGYVFGQNMYTPRISI